MTDDKPIPARQQKHVLFAVGPRRQIPPAGAQTDAMKAKPDPQTTELHRALNRACRELNAREITLRYLPPPSLTRWIATALVVHHRVLAGELTM
jgi:hypothetical protein